MKETISSKIDIPDPKAIWDQAMQAVESGDADLFWNSWNQLNGDLQKSLAEALNGSNSPDFEEKILTKLGNFDDDKAMAERENRYTALGEVGESNRDADLASADFLKMATLKDGTHGSTAAKAIFDKAMRALMKEDEELRENFIDKLLSISKECQDERAVAAINNLSNLAGSAEALEKIRSTLQELMESEKPDIVLAAIDELFQLATDLEEKYKLIHKKLTVFNWEIASKEDFPEMKIILAQQLEGLTDKFPETTERLLSDTNELVRDQIEMSKGTYKKN